MLSVFLFFFKQKTAYELRISDWSSDVCSSDLFPAIADITSRVDVPVLVMTYRNPVLQYGVDRYADDLAAAGGAGLITPDITPESAGEWIAASEQIGRASGRERVCPYMSTTGVAGSIRKKHRYIRKLKEN